VFFKVNKPNTAASSTVRVNQNLHFIDFSIASDKLLQLFLCVCKRKMANVDVFVVAWHFMAVGTLLARLQTATLFAFDNGGTKARLILLLISIGSRRFCNE
jgi:hypothetical protein